MSSNTLSGIPVLLITKVNLTNLNLYQELKAQFFCQDKF